MTYSTKYGGKWTPGQDITDEQAEKTIRLFPHLRDGASLNALARIIDKISNVVEMKENSSSWYEFSLCGGHGMVRGSVNFD